MTTRHRRAHLPARLLLGALLLAGTALAGAAPPPQANAEQRSLELAAAIHAWHQAPAAARAARLATLIAVAQERQALLLELLEENPAEVRRLALPPGLTAGLPAELAGLVEQRVEVEGELTALYEDPETGPGRLRHYLETPAGERLELHFTTPPGELATGSHIAARGLRLGHPDDADASLVLGATEQELSVLALGETAAVTGTGPAVLPDTRGAQRLAVLLVNFASQPDEQPWSVEDAQLHVFSHVNAFMRENSQGLTWLEGDVHGWLTIDYDRSACTTSSITGDFTTKANQAAAAAGIDLSRYRRVLYLFPYATGCSWSGLGTVGGNPSRAWVKATLSTLVTGHELGHNLGLWHAHALECGAAVNGEVGDTCASVEYGDQFSIMGNSGPRHFAPFHKAQLGWLDQPDTEQIAEVTASGSYQIAPYINGNGGDPVALKVPRAPDPATGAARWYYLEYREPVGYDSPLASNANVANGVLLRSAADSVRDSSYALDLTPGSNTSSYYDWSDPALVGGASYTDAAAGLSLTTLWTAASGASVEVRFAAPDCVRAAPALTLTPADGQWAAPGTRVEYSLRVDNRDSTACAAASFALTATVPAGWPAAELAASLSLAPGASATLPLRVTSALDAADGYYAIGYRVEPLADAALATTGSATYVVQRPAVAPPVAVDDQASTAENTAVVIPVLANDWDPQQLPLTLTTTGVPAKGQVRINADGTLTYTPNNRARGGDSFSYQISSGLASASAVVNVQIQRSGTKGGGKPSR